MLQKEELIRKDKNNIILDTWKKWDQIRMALT